MVGPFTLDTKLSRSVKLNVASVHDSGGRLGSMYKDLWRLEFGSHSVDAYLDAAARGVPLAVVSCLHF